MVQFNYDPPRAMVGQFSTMEPHDLISVENPLRAQVTNLEFNGITTDGNYSLTIQGTDGSSATSDAFAASSNSAAQICAGIVAGCLSSPAFAGLISGASVVTTDNVELQFAARGVVYTVTANVPGSAPTQSNTTTAGYSEIPLGALLQSDGAGGFTTSYNDAALALGIVVRGVDLVQPLIADGVTGYTGPCMIPVLAMGAAELRVVSGVSVLRGQKVYYNGTNKTYSNATTGSHVLVEGAQWRTSGSGIQRAWVRLPSET